MKGVAHGRSFLVFSRYMVQLITPKVPAMAVSTVITILRISFQLIFIAVIYYLTIGRPDGNFQGLS